MQKNLSELIDELSITNCKVFALVDKVKSENGTIEDAKKLQSANEYRSQLKNSINSYFKEREEIKI